MKSSSYRPPGVTFPTGDEMQIDIFGHLFIETRYKICANEALNADHQEMEVFAGTLRNFFRIFLPPTSTILVAKS